MRSAALTAALLLLAALAAPETGATPPLEESAVDPGEPRDASPPGSTKERAAYWETVQVTGSRNQKPIKDEIYTMTVLREVELATAPGDNYADLLGRVPGLNVSQTSARDINITSRASTSTLSSGQLALLDGRSIYQDFFGFIAWDFLPVGLDEIKQIEVIRGPGSAVWGANATNGVVNIITKAPAESAGTSLRLSAGEVGTFAASARHAGVNGDLSYKVSVGYFEQDAWERDTELPDGTPLPEGARFQNVGTKQPKLDLRLDYQAGPESQWSFSGGMARTSGIIHTGIGPFDIADSTILGYFKGEYRHDDLRLTGYLNTLDGDARNLLNGLDFLFKNQTLHLELQDRASWRDRHAFTYGASVRGNFFDLSIAPRDDLRTELGVFLQDEFFISDEMQINMGARLDWFDTIGWTASPRLSLLIKPDHNNTFRVSYNRAYRAPSLVNNYLDTSIASAVELPTGLFTFPIAATGSEELDEETLDAFEIGWTGVVADRLTISLAAYFNRTRNVIDFAAAEFYGSDNPPPGWPLPPELVPPSTLPSLFVYRNIGQVDDKGFELGVDVDISPSVTATFNYSFQAEPQVDDEGSAIPLDVNIPARHRFNLGGSFVLDRIQGSASVSYTGEALWTDVLDARFHGTTDSYTLLNGSFAVRLADGRLTLGVKGTNLTNKRVKQHVFGDIIGRKVVGEARWSM